MTIGLSPTKIPEPLLLTKRSEAMNGFKSRNGNYVGHLYDSESHDGPVYVTFREEEKHYMKKYNSFAIDVSIIDSLMRRHDAKHIAVFVVETGKIMLFKPETYESALVDQHPGFGKQYFPEQTEAHTVYEKAFEHAETGWYPDEIKITPL